MTPQRYDQRGFTLIELLVVIVILGILSAVVVFAVKGVGDKGHDAAIAADARSIRTAEEAFCANEGRYGEFDELVARRYLSDEPTLHSVEVFPHGGRCNGSGYVLDTIPTPPDATDPPPGLPVCGAPGGW